MKKFSNIFKNIMEGILEQEPLIHCITNPISIHDCANVVLAVGARPIMAEHPREVREITAGAKALALNIGNITDARMESVMISGREAAERGIPTVLDMVGIGCSRIRKELVLDFLRQREGINVQAPLILKGNMSEVKALWTEKGREEVHTDGVDVRNSDVLTAENEAETIRVITDLAAAHHGVILATGKTDVVTDGTKVYLAENGCPAMSQITGTGCMLTVLTAAYASQNKTAKMCTAPEGRGMEYLTEAALLAAVVSGICGERAAEEWKGTGTFHVRLMDEFSRCTWEIVEKYRKVREWNEK